MKKDLRWYLFDEFIESSKEYWPNISNNIVRYMKKRELQFKNPLIILYLKLMRVIYYIFYPIIIKKTEKKILFQQGITRYTSIITHSSKKNALVIGINKGMLMDYLTKRTIFFPLFDNVYQKLYYGLINDKEDYIYSSMDNLKSNLKYLNPDVIILNDDHLPASRALAIVAKKLKIPTVVIQDGIYQSNSFIPSGNYSDYVFVWGKYFKNLYLKNNIIESKKIKILGYPYEIKKIKPKKKSKDTKSVCYLGQNFEDYYKNLINIKINTIKELDYACKRIGLNFVFRPHPQDNIKFLKSKLPEIEFSPKNESFISSLKKNDIFISFNSTSLVEAAIMSKLCIQLKNYPIPSDDFEKVGICKSFDSIENVSDFLNKISKNDLSNYTNSINEKYIEMSNESPGEKFIKLLEEIGII